MTKALNIHIFSIIPRLSEYISKKLPEANIQTILIKDDISKKYEKVVTKEELQQLQGAQIILGDANLIAQVYQDLSDVKWVQCTWAGIEKLVNTVKNGKTPTYPVTRLAVQPFSQLMAEYVVGQILNNERGWLDARQYQLQKTWAHKDNIATYRSLQDLTVSVMGVGMIGSEIINALKFFKCKVFGYGRNPSAPQELSLDGYYSTTDLSSLIANCDYLVNILPSTPETNGLLGKETLSLARKKPVLINIGRANIICEEEIITALDKSWISAAILDVFETEPLPPSSPLWLHPKVLLTPHVGGVSRACDVADAFSANLDRYLKGEPLKNVIEWDKGY